MKYFQIDSHFFLINLDQKIEGFRDFISSWLYMNDDMTFLVDPGPSSSIDVLKEILEKIGVKALDYILLTHIHIDHAGGTGKLLASFPGAKVLCHPKGIEHLINQAKLWKGTLTVLGEIARAYGEIFPVPGGSIFFEKIIKKKNRRIEVIETPGHAFHHLSYVFNHYLFAGEVAGVYHPLPDKIYMRPATPPRFDLDTSLSSLEKIMAKKPETICFGHYGFHKDALRILLSAREQLLLWTELIKGQSPREGENWENKVIEKLMEKDKKFSNFQYLEKDIQKRERYFLTNSLNGIMEYLIGR